MTTSKPDPSIHPSEEYEHPQWPVRDDSMLGPTEDLDREPDGFPHVAMAVTWLTIFAFAAMLLALSTRNKVDDVLLVIVGVPVIVFALTRWAARKRDRLHPSV